MRRKRFTYDPIPESVKAVVVAVIGDYGRRCALLRKDGLRDEQRETLINLNECVDKAFLQLDTGERSILLADIKEGRGYEKSEAHCFMSKDAYYRRRKQVILVLAKDLKLL